MKNYLFVLQGAPYGGIRAQEMLDIVLTTAAFDQAVAVLLLDDAVFQIKRGQRSDQVGMKDVAAIFSALNIYDVKHVYAEIESLQERGLKPDDLVLPIEAIDRKDIGALMKQYDLIFSG